LLLPLCFWLLPGSGQAAKPTFNTLYSFEGGAHGDGDSPFGTLAMDASGVLYGVTSIGGAYSSPACSTGGCGTVFSLSPPVSPGAPWTEEVLWSFGGFAEDGNGPNVVIVGSGGVLYGAAGGGASGGGIVFSLAPPASPGAQWTETILWNFAGGPSDGFGPSGVVLGADGVLYGTTAGGGTSGFGTVFALSPSSGGRGAWTETILWNFAGAAGDGAYPDAPMVFGSSGSLYGTTTGGGASGKGIVFSVTPPGAEGGSWTENVLASFGRNANGSSSPLTVGRSGVLYRETRSSPLSWGTVFALMPPPARGGVWKKRVLFTFPKRGPKKTKYGGDPAGPLVELADGSLLGLSQMGGTLDDGTLYRLKPRRRQVPAGACG